MVRAGLNGERVASAGADLADEIGFGAVTISLLARRLGVRTPSLYSHVDGSGDLRLRIAATALAESADQVEAEIAARPEDPRLRVYADAWRDFARRHPGRYDATRQPVPPGADSDAARAVLAAGRRHADLARDVLRDYRVADADETHAVRLLGSLVHGFVSLELAGGFAHSLPSGDTSWEYVMGALEGIVRPTAG